MHGLVVLSPHFDDGALSCGGQIFCSRVRGANVRVLTLFAGGAQRTEIPPFAAEQHHMWGDPPDANRLRRAEDFAAYARLGCFDVYHLDAPDAVYRLDARGDARYGNVHALFANLHPEEAEYDLALLELARPLVHADAIILAPLAIGGHVDHQLTHRVARLLEAEGWEVGYYEDVPYVDKVDLQTWEPAGAGNFRIETIPLGEMGLEAKIAATAYYRTQIPVLYGSETEMHQRLRLTAERAGNVGAPMAERLWWRSHDNNVYRSGGEGAGNERP